MFIKKYIIFLIILATYSFTTHTMQTLNPVSDGHKIFTYYAKLALAGISLGAYLTIRDALTLASSGQSVGINYGNVFLDAAVLTLSIQSFYFSMKWRKDCANNVNSSCIECIA